MQFGAVIGSPIQHSLSPAIYSALAREAGRPFAYSKFDVSKENLESFLRLCSKHGLFLGLNITIPHKEEVGRWVDELSDEARITGAVNMVRFQEGKSIGYNTDIKGILNSLKDADPDFRPVSAVIFGAGGAALAAAYAMGVLGASQVALVNRHLARTFHVVSRLEDFFPNTRFEGFEFGALLNSTPDIYINATPLGMSGFPPESVLPANANPEAFAFDLVYRPLDTPFLKDAVKHGLKPISGLDMLIWQALENWKLWFGELNSPVKMKRFLDAELRAILDRGSPNGASRVVANGEVGVMI